MDLVRLLLAVWRHKILALLLLAVSLGAAVGYLQVAPKVYESSASLAAVPNTTAGQRSDFNGLVDRLLPTLAELAKGAEVRESVSTSAPETPPLEVRADAPQGTLLLRIHVRHADPESAAAWANALARDLPQFVPDPDLARLQITERARVPAEPVAPVPAVLLPLAVLLGLGLAITAAVLADEISQTRAGADHGPGARGRRSQADPEPSDVNRQRRDAGVAIPSSSVPVPTTSPGGAAS